MSHFRVFKEISIGGLTKEQLLWQLSEKTVKLNSYAEMLIGHSSFSPGPKVEKINLVKVSLSDLHMTSPCSLEQILENAATLGLKTCPLFLAAFLRLQYMDQPEGPYLTIASAKLEENEEYPSGFYLRNFEGFLWLRGYRAVGECEWPTDNEFVFLK